MRDLRKNGVSSTTTSANYNFHQWVTGQRKITVDPSRKLSGEARKPVATAIFPFSFNADMTAVADEHYVRVTMSKYSYFGWKNRMSTVLTDLGLGWKIPDSTNRERPEGFFPAMARITLTKTSGATTETPEANHRSGITNQEYSYIQRRTFSLPFGRTIKDIVSMDDGAVVTELEKADYEEVIAVLEAKVLGQTVGTTEYAGIPDARRLFFDPEVYRQDSQVMPGYNDTLNASGVTVG